MTYLYFSIMFNTLLSSLADTLDGEVNVAMLVYQSGEAAIQLFSGDSPQARKILGAALPALATQGDYKVLLVQPEDQDFDVSLVARSRASLMEIEMVKVKEGQEERFTQLRNRYKARARSSSNVQDVQVFKVVQVSGGICIYPIKHPILIL